MIKLLINTQFVMLGIQTAPAVLATVPARPVLDLRLPVQRGWLVDLLNPGSEFFINSNQVRIDIPPAWGRVLALKSSSKTGQGICAQQPGGEAAGAMADKVYGKTRFECGRYHYSRDRR